jgi:hypothetical protein
MKYILLIALLVGVLLTTACVTCENKCNDACYNPNTQTCCFDTVLEGQWALDKENKECVNMSDTSESYCGGVTYHSKDLKGCCNGTTYNRSMSCYKNQLYIGLHRACGNSLLCSEGMECCNVKDTGPVCINPETDWCMRTYYRNITSFVFR